ncbi:uncharacterized protein LOC132757173 [Ruditapes philippinarum]|uniref:uncharacterized protein LOC132757173 n=1 Tax=Ruditapes philippinarum TaxID=129788 RepID=UPI00295C26B7|nr:uncharacterized protein LOC132757173 [Ruditapes philippinarum]
MEVIGRKNSDTNSVICKHCADENKRVPANGLCRECEEHMCIACFGNHKKYKVCKDHALIDIDSKVEDEKTETEDDAFVPCPQHMKEQLKFYCTCHDDVGCGDCMVLNHKSCNVEYIADVARAFKDSETFKDIVKQVGACQTEVDKCDKSIEHNKTLVHDTHEGFLAGLKSFRDELKLKLEQLEAVLLEKANAVKERETKRMDAIGHDCEELKGDLTQICNRIESNCSQTNVFIATVQAKCAMKEIELNLGKIQSQNTISKYTFKRNDKIEELLRETELGIMDEIMDDETPVPASQEHKGYEVATSSKTDSLARNTLRNDELNLDGYEKAKPLSPHYSNTDLTCRECQTVISTGDYEKPISSKDIAGKCASTYEDTLSISSTQDYEDLIYEEIPQSKITRRKSSSKRKSWSLFENQLKCENILMAGDIVTFKDNNKGDIGLFVWKRSVKAGTYFEVEIINTESNGNISIGFIPKDYSLKEQPGDGRFSMGFHSADGCIHCEDAPHKRISAPCKNGDVIGFGVCSFLSNVFKTSMSISVTKNSQKIGTLDVNNPSFCKLFPAVGLKSSSDKARVIMDVKMP